jgi:DNA-directed RNA polymerase specialized sigma24 family protein
MLINKATKNYVKSNGRNLITSLMNKRRYLDEEDIISELTMNLVEELTDKLDGKFTQAFFNKALRRDLLDWIKFNKRQRREESYPIQYIEEAVDEEETLTLDILPGGMQSEEPTPEDYLIAKQLEEFTDKYFEEDELDVLFGKVSCKDMAKKLDIPYSTYNGHLNRKIKKFKIEAEKGGYI